MIEEYCDEIKEAIEHIENAVLILGEDGVDGDEQCTEWQKYKIGEAVRVLYESISGEWVNQAREHGGRFDAKEEATESWNR